MNKDPIPKDTFYCHDRQGKPCPYWTRIDKNNKDAPIFHCEFLDEEDVLLSDQVTICGVGMPEGS